MNGNPVENETRAAGDGVAAERATREPAAIDYWRILRRNRRAVLGISLSVLLIGILSAVLIRPVYRAEATLLVEPAQPKFVSMSQLEGLAPLNLFYETQYDVIRSRTVAESAMATLDRHTLDLLAKTARPSDSGPRAWLPGFLDRWFADEADQGDEQARHDAILKAVSSNLTVRGGERSQIIVVGFDAADPETAAKVANAVVGAYIEHGLEARLATVKQGTDWLADRLHQLREKMEQSEAAKQAFQAREAMVDTDNHKHIITARLSSLGAELVKAQTERSEAEIRVQRIDDLIAKGANFEALLPVLNDSFLNGLAQDLVGLDRKLSELSERYGPKHPKIISATADRDEARRRLQAETDKVVAKIRNDFTAAKAKERDTERLIEAQQEEMRALSGKAFELAKLEREVESNRQLYETFQERFKEMDVAGKNAVTNVQIIDPAKPPQEAFKPNRRAIVLLALIFGVFLGVTAVFVRARLDNTFKTAEDVEQRLALPVFALLPSLDGARDQVGVAERWFVREPHSAFSEAINNIRTGIKFSSIDEPIRSVLVTSALPAEGKTTLACNLALSFSQIGKTLFIDADMRHPSIATALDLAKGPGLSEWIGGRQSLQECIVPDRDVQELHILASGAIPPKPLELLSSRRFHENFTKLCREYEYIVIDTPPVLPASDAIVLAQLVDAVIVTIKADDTPFDVVNDMLKRLYASHVAPLGAVLSLVDLNALASYYGTKYYGQYYGEYYGARDGGAA